MAKSKLPSVDDVAPIAAPAHPNRPSVEVTADASAVAVADPAEAQPATEGYLPRRVDLRLTRSQAVALKEITRRLEDSGAELNNGRPVAGRSHAIQWLLENPGEVL